MSRKADRSRKRDYWRREIRWIDGQKVSSPRFPGTPDGRAAADSWYEQKKIEKRLILEGMELPFQPRKLEEFSREWLPGRVYEVEEVTWREEQAKLLNRILPKFGQREMHTLRPAEIKDWLRDMIAEGLHPTTVDHHRAVLNKILNDAIRHDPPHLRQNPVEAVRRFSKYDNRKRPAVWSEDQCRKYLAACQKLGTVYYLAMMFYVNTGGRQSEVIALKHGDIDLETRSFTIRRVRERKTGKLKERTKSGHQRTLGMNAHLLAAYRTWLAELKRAGAPAQPGDFLFTRQARRKGQPWTAAVVRWWHDRAVKDAGIPMLTPHGLRHTFASLFAMKAGNTRALQGVLGHETARTTERYTHFLPGHLASQAAVVEIAPGRPKRRKRAGRRRAN